MNNQEVQQEIFGVLKTLTHDESIVINENTALIGENSILDSMTLVELCVTLEDIAAEKGFEFDWTSDAAMSRSRSMFRTAGSLVNEFVAQMNDKK
jgi:acyl carrier protein